MAWLSKILAPVDFSPRCRAALQQAEALASHFHSELALLHVVVPPMALYASPETQAYSTAGELIEERVAHRLAELESFPEDQCPSVNVVRTVVIGDPAREIVTYANQQKVGLIVLSTHGYGPFRRFLLGSVTAKVLHDAACPVWTGPHLEEVPDYRTIAFRKILCAIDLAKGSWDVLNWAAQLAAVFSAGLEIVHVLPESLVRFGGLYFDPEWRQQAARTAHAQIDRLREELRLDAAVHIEIGDAPATISHLASARNADLLVIGRGNAGGVMGRLRANAYAILRESPCPVATI